jgi:hypothetical protein
VTPACLCKDFACRARPDVVRGARLGRGETMKKTPLKRVNEEFSSKDKLVEELLGLIKRPADITKDQMKKKLSAQSNRKLLTLMKREQSVKKSYGTRDKLIDAIVKAGMGKDNAEDKVYRKRLAALTTGQLLDLARRYHLGK